MSTRVNEALGRVLTADWQRRLEVRVSDVRDGRAFAVTVRRKYGDRWLRASGAARLELDFDEIPQVCACLLTAYSRAVMDRKYRKSEGRP